MWLLVASGSQKSSHMQYGQLVGNSALQPAAQSQLCYQYDATAQPALATSPVQSDPLIAAQSSQIIGSQLVQQRSVFIIVIMLLEPLLHFARGIAKAKCMLVTAVHVSVCLSLVAFLHYCTDPDVSWATVGGALWLCTVGRIYRGCMHKKE